MKQGEGGTLKGQTFPIWNSTVSACSEKLGYVPLFGAFRTPTASNSYQLINCWEIGARHDSDSSVQRAWWRKPRLAQNSPHLQFQRLLGSQVDGIPFAARNQ